MTTPTTGLCPAQQQALDHLLRILPIGNVFTLYGDTGRGKTIVLQEFHRTAGGVFLNMKDFVSAMYGRHPFALEETFEQMMLAALRTHDLVILDDLHLLSDIACSYNYPRSDYLNAPLTTLATYAAEADKKLVFGCGSSVPAPIRERGHFSSIREFRAEDYASLCHIYLGAELAEGLDFEKVYRFAPELNAHQLKGACAWFQQEGGLDTQTFIEYLRLHHMASNVNLDEVQVVDLYDLKGVDDVIQSLEVNIILPLENDALAAEIGIKPKRGVLLAGPPGTGKTTVGRALAHRLKSKFFLVDGTFISGTDEFYGRIQRVFHAAKHNAPAIIFIDDSDVIFENGEESGLYRYLLTMLDGLESESAGRVCVMMTAMDVGNLPPALMRSGRVELWLETRLPDEAARAAILGNRLAALPAHLGEVDAARLVAATEGLTGADLKRLIEDGKLLYAADRAKERPLRPLTDYFLAALETLRINKERYLAAANLARQQHPARPPWFDVNGDRAVIGSAIPDE
jgi:hypothetical protein